MKLKKLVGILTLLIVAQSAQATELTHSKDQTKLPTESTDQLWLKQIKAPKISVYGTVDEFKFSSSTGILFHRYNGHTNTASLGIDNIKLSTLSTGLYVTHFDTQMLTFSKLGPFLNESSRSTHDNGVYAHATKNIVTHVQIDVFGGYGRNRFNLRNTSETERFGTLTGYSKYYGHDEVAGVRGLFSYYFNHFFLQGDVDYFYARINQPDYVVLYPNNQITIPKLTTNVGTYLENAKLSYFLNDYLSPFITGSLIQVGSRSFSRPVVSPSSAASPQPELVIGKSGYTYGGGVLLKYKKIILTASYKHENRKQIYLSSLYLLKLDWSLG